MYIEGVGYTLPTGHDQWDNRQWELYCCEILCMINALIEPPIAMTQWPDINHMSWAVEASPWMFQEAQYQQCATS